MINVIFSCPDRRLPTIFTWDHTRSETSSCNQHSPCLLLPVCLQRKLSSVTTYISHYDQFRYNIKLQQKVIIGYVCKVITECGQDRKIPCHARKFAHYVVNCNVMIPSNTNTTPERKKKTSLVCRSHPTKHTYYDMGAEHADSDPPLYEWKEHLSLQSTKFTKKYIKTHLCNYYTIKWSVTDPDETSEERKMPQFMIDVWSSYVHNGKVAFFTYTDRLLQKSDNYTGGSTGWVGHSK
jgi:hypothetical protein